MLFKQLVDIHEHYYKPVLEFLIFQKHKNFLHKTNTLSMIRI